ncbi:hypothetical protein F4823DRAFT_608315 [Ustulina deusta]|nr:hypothetical protein F4823DRAFT_608315 [Ustulina deusta]
MADLARTARPWLFPLRQPMRTSTVASPYLGIAYRRAISATTACRALKPRDRNSPRRPPLKDQALKRESRSSFLLPYTIVAPPVWRFPRSPVKFWRMAWLLAKNRAFALLSMLGVYIESMNRAFRWPLFRARRRNCIPTAKALHVQMSEAVAAGDKETLRRVCTTELFQTLAGTIDARPAGLRTEWELVRYRDRLAYPRLADFRVTYLPVPGGKAMKLIKQAVVSISSVQRLTRYDDAKGGAKVPGGARERHMTEHIVLQAEIKDKTYEAEPWKIWGTLPEMSYEAIRDDIRMFDEATANNARRRGRS